MQCPKDKRFTLASSLLSGSLAVQCCPDCKGMWIAAADYQSWQTQHSPTEPDLQVIPSVLEVEFVQSPYDTKASLCPECRRYLSRARVNTKPAFYVERCPECHGIWCDYGEWEVLEKLGWHTNIERLFSSEWQAKLREREFAEQEKQATIAKLGDELAQKVFELADLLQKHPHGDFGVAYLMRRFDQRSS